MTETVYGVVGARVLSPVRLSVTQWTVACQTPLFMGFPRQEYCSGLWQDAAKVAELTSKYGRNDLREGHRLAVSRLTCQRVDVAEWRKRDAAPR